ncbi:hypothetical protein CBG25_17845 [Arsenophonus sp. ENCA]|nr:hypothetical protein CBG25_17845 [Arsenophonus sp. ENCA]
MDFACALLHHYFLIPSYAFFCFFLLLFKHFSCFFDYVNVFFDSNAIKIALIFDYHNHSICMC